MDYEQNSYGDYNYQSQQNYYQPPTNQQNYQIPVQQNVEAQHHPNTNQSWNISQNKSSYIVSFSEFVFLGIDLLILKLNIY